MSFSIEAWKFIKQKNKKFRWKYQKKAEQNKIDLYYE